MVHRRRLDGGGDDVQAAEAAGVDAGARQVHEPFGPPGSLVESHDRVRFSLGVGAVDEVVAEVEEVDGPVALPALGEPFEVTEVEGEAADAWLVVVVAGEEPIVPHGLVEEDVVDVQDVSALEDAGDVEASASVLGGEQPNGQAVLGLRVVLAPQHAVVRADRDGHRRLVGPAFVLDVAGAHQGLAGRRVEDGLSIGGYMGTVREDRQGLYLVAQQAAGQPGPLRELPAEASRDGGHERPSLAVVAGAVDLAVPAQVHRAGAVHEQGPRGRGAYRPQLQRGRGGAVGGGHRTISFPG